MEIKLIDFTISAHDIARTSGCNNNASKSSTRFESSFNNSNGLSSSLLLLDRENEKNWNPKQGDSEIVKYLVKLRGREVANLSC